jgi:nucleotide-binding universal stress UspA family protein
VLAAVDLEGDGVDDVLGFAFAEAARRRSAVRAVYVRDRPWHLEYATDIEVVDVTFARATEEAGRQLAAIPARWHAKHPEVPATHEVLVAPPGAALVEQARNADLAVVGAMRRADAHHGLRVGPVAHTVLLHADCPVAVVPMELKAGA